MSVLAAKLGRSVYELEETSNPAGVVKFTRRSASGELTVFYVPVDLLTMYVAQRVQGMVPELLRKAMKR